MELFENIKHINPKSGVKYWFARELQVVLGYARWRRFCDTIERAKSSCETSGINVSDHFANVDKMITLGKGGKRNKSITP